VVLPAALPTYVAGLKQGWAFAWRSLLAGELLVQIAGKSSLGRELSISSQNADFAAMYATMIVILVIGLCADAVFGYAERRIRRRYGLVDAADA
jgi:NitT/TauT family transport system permease protein